MVGERIDLAADAGGLIQSFVEALQRFPSEAMWCVVGGFAVNIRIADTHRFTNDLDTVSRSQAELVEALTYQPAIERVSSGKVRLISGRRALDIDIMSDASDVAMPANPSERAFASARRMALATSESATVNVIGAGRVVASAHVRVATVPALIAMKAVAIPRRVGTNPHKVGSDIHDLYRLAISNDFEAMASSIAAHDRQLSSWVGSELVKLFSPERDLRYTYARLRRYHPTDLVTEADLGMVAELGRLMS